MATLAGAGLASCGQASSRRPNILFVMTDDQAIGDMSCYGNAILKTPNMDRIAAEGVRFSNSFVTNSLCAPSRATALTGCFSHINGIRGNSEGANSIEKLNPSLPTFPRLLQQAGYRTGLVGKWHLSEDPAGFDTWTVLPGQGLYHNPDFIVNGTRRKFEGYATDLTTDFALDFLRNAGSQPFCLVYQHKSPHRPAQPAARHAKFYDDIEIPYPATFHDRFQTRRLAKEAEDMRMDISLAGDYKDLPKGLSPEQRKRWIYQRFVKDRYRSLVGVDENLGRVLKHLDEHNLAEDTVVVYTSDNGFFVGEHGWYDKRFMYEPSLRVPLLVRYPRLRVSNRVDDHMVQNIDLAPTILDLAGVPVPETMQGRSLRTLLEGQAPEDWRRSIYYAYFENSWALRNVGKEGMSDPSFQYFTPHRVSPHRGVRTERYKLIEYYAEDNYWELFDLAKDPNEERNEYGQADYAQITAELKQELSRLRELYRDTA